QVPEVEDVSFTRGLAGGASCDQLGFLTIKLRWPRGPHDLEDVGFEYRVVNGEAPEDLLPEGLVVAPVRGRRTEHQLTWNDGAPGEQRPLRLLLEVRAVTSDGLRGPPAQVRVGAPWVTALRRGRCHNPGMDATGRYIQDNAPRVLTVAVTSRALFDLEE